MNKILLFDNSNAGTSSVEFYMLGLQVFARWPPCFDFWGRLRGGVPDDQHNFIQTIAIAPVVRIAPLRIRGVCIWSSWSPWMIVMMTTITTFVVYYIFLLFTIRNTISKNVQGTRGAILTTHSMEEADALCSRVGIMVKGRLKWVCYIKWFFVITQFLVVQWIPYDWLRKLAPLSQPIRSKPKPIVCRPLYFSRALRRLHRC